MIIFQTVFKLWTRHEIASETIKGKYLGKYESEMSFLYVTHRHDLFYITVKYLYYISKGSQVTGGTRTCIKKHQKGDNSKSIKARALIFVCHIIMTCST